MGGNQDDEDNNFMDTNYEVGFWQVYMLGVAMVLTGPFSDWNHGFVAGFGGFMIVYAIVVLGYTSLVFCLAEMTSTVAFASGTYGYVRCTIGPLYGFLVGCCELIENNVLTLCCVYTIALSMTAVTEMDRNYEPLWMFLTYAAAVFVLMPGGQYLWRVMYVLCAFTLTVLYLYLFTVWTTQPKMWSADLTQAPHNRIVGGATTVLQQLFRPNWFYIGFEVITVTGKNMPDGTKVLPRALMAVFFTVAITCTLIVFTTGAYFQDLLDVISWEDIALTVFTPLIFGYQNGLGMSTKASYAFTIIAMFGSVLGFHYTSTQLMQAMALSGLLPPVLKRWSGPNKVPVNALLFSTFLQYTVLVFGWSVSLYPPFFTLCILSSCVVYFGAFGAFLSFRYRFGHMTRLFTSPFGVFGGVFGFMLFLFMFFVVAVFNVEDLTIYYFIGYMGACLIYYIVYAEKNQFFSPEEQKRFLKAYILNAKTKKASNHTILERIYLAFNCLALREASSLNSRSRNTGSSATAAASKNKAAAASMRSVARKDDDDAAPSPSTHNVAKLNSVVPVESVVSPPAASSSSAVVVSDSSRDGPTGSVRASNKVVSFANEEKKNDGSSPSRRLTWSGKVLDNAESVKFLTMMTSTKNKDDVLSAFPDLLIPSTAQREVEEEVV